MRLTTCPNCDTKGVEVFYAKSFDMEVCMECIG